ncbi:hypothetical protein ES708_34955 [subsurface metagenome]
MLIRIILILGSIVGLVISAVVLVMGLCTHPTINWGDLEDVSVFVFVIFCIIFFTLNTYNVLSGRRGHIFLYFKRKILEEEIKIQEAENRLEALQKKLDEK